MDFLPLKEFPNCSATARPTSSIGSNIRTTTDYWRKLCIEESHAKIDVPAFNIGGWYDIFQGGTIRNYLGMKARGATDAVAAASA